MPSAIFVPQSAAIGKARALGFLSCAVEQQVEDAGNRCQTRYLRVPRMTDAATLVPTTTLVPTPNTCALPRRFSNFATFGEALDYAATGSRGMNFHDPRGNLVRPYPFRELREDSLAMARRLIAHGIGKGDRSEERRVGKECRL